jgi:hypothetical protein
MSVPLPPPGRRGLPLVEQSVGDLVPEGWWPVGAEPVRCAGCGEGVNSAEGVAVDAAGGRWHPECRRAARGADA